MIKNPTNIEIYQGVDSEKDSIKSTASVLAVFIAEDTDVRYLLGLDKEWYPFTSAFQYFSFV